MEYRRLGNTGLQVSAIGFGCSRIARADRREATAVLEAAVEMGVTLFDTSVAYEDDEQLLGRVLGPHRDRLVLCSKAGYRHWFQLELERWGTIPTRRWDTSARGGGSSPERRRRNFSPRALRLALDGSLRRLRTDRLDIFYLHSPPPDVLSDDAVFDTLESLKQSGRIRQYGISYHEAATTEAVLTGLGRPGPGVMQVMTNPLGGVALDRIAPVATTAGVGIVARQLFHRGAVLRSPHLAALAAPPMGRTLAQTIVLATLQRAEISSALIGMRSRAHLAENLRALSLPPLTSEERARAFSSWL
jgi:aryl-alcohol dehydrogenase-like predicted oxidoreductase